jgi:hypothetical protein
MKVKIVVTAVLVCEVDPAFYPEGITAEEMVQIDVQNTIDDPFLVLDNDDVVWTVEGEVL